jgi:hypothetical protein
MPLERDQQIIDLIIISMIMDYPSPIIALSIAVNLPYTHFMRVSFSQASTVWPVRPRTRAFQSTINAILSLISNALAFRLTEESQPRRQRREGSTHHEPYVTTSSCVFMAVLAAVLFCRTKYSELKGCGSMLLLGRIRSSNKWFPIEKAWEGNKQGWWQYGEQAVFADKKWIGLWVCGLCDSDQSTYCYAVKGLFNIWMVYIGN